MQKITPFLWYDNQAEAAAKYYVSIFKNSKILKIDHYGDAGAEVSGRKKGSVMTVQFRIEGQEFIALNGGPHFTFSSAISFIVDCKTQKEVDKLWGKLSAGGKVQQCGWLTDKFGVTWQIVPATLNDLLKNKDAKKTERVWRALLKMKKIDIAKLKQAWKG